MNSDILAGMVIALAIFMAGMIAGCLIGAYYLRDDPGAETVPANTAPVPDFPPVVPLNYAPTGYVGSDISGGGW